MIDFDGGTLGSLKRDMEALDLRAKVAMHNIANQNTPGFKRYYVSFEELLRAAFHSGSDAQAVQPQVLRDTSGAPGMNNVSLIDEQAVLEKVRLMNELVSRRIGGHFSKLNKAISSR